MSSNHLAYTDNKISCLDWTVNMCQWCGQSIESVAERWRGQSREQCSGSAVKLRSKALLVQSRGVERCDGQGTVHWLSNRRELVLHCVASLSNWSPQQQFYKKLKIFYAPYYITIVQYWWWCWDIIPWWRYPSVTSQVQLWWKPVS